MSNKASEIKAMFKINLFSKEFSTQRMTDKNPYNILVMVDGFIVPLNTLPLEFQKIVREARARGEDVEFEPHKNSYNCQYL